MATKNKEKLLEKLLDYTLKTESSLNGNFNANTTFTGAADGLAIINACRSALNLITIPSSKIGSFSYPTDAPHKPKLASL